MILFEIHHGGGNLNYTEEARLDFKIDSKIYLLYSKKKLPS